MKKFSYIIALLMAVVVFAGCENYETYSDMKKKEQDAIEAFIAEHGIQVIDQTTFEAQGNKTDLASNQFVKFTRNGVYMQIVRELSSLGTGIDVSQYLDKMSVVRTGTTLTASFLSGMMYQYHGSTSVPGGWLVPLNYVKIGRPDPAREDDETAKVRLIVPHSQGTADASSSVTPYYYEITYERER